MIPEIIIPFASGLIGTGVGATVTLALVSHKIGKWQGTIEARVTHNKTRLDSGHERVQDVPALKDAVARLSGVIDRMEDRERGLNEVYVLRRECDRRHKTEKTEISG